MRAHSLLASILQGSSAMAVIGLPSMEISYASSFAGSGVFLFPLPLPEQNAEGGRKMGGADVVPQAPCQDF